MYILLADISGKEESQTRWKQTGCYMFGSQYLPQSYPVQCWATWGLISYSFWCRPRHRQIEKVETSRVEMAGYVEAINILPLASETYSYFRSQLPVFGIPAQQPQPWYKVRYVWVSLPWFYMSIYEEVFILLTHPAFIDPCISRAVLLPPSVELDYRRLVDRQKASSNFTHKYLVDLLSAILYVVPLNHILHPHVLVPTATTCVAFSGACFCFGLAKISQFRGYKTVCLGLHSPHNDILLSDLSSASVATTATHSSSSFSSTIIIIISSSVVSASFTRGLCY